MRAWVTQLLWSVAITLGLWSSNAAAQALKVGVVAEGEEIARAVELFERQHRNIDVVMERDQGDPAVAEGVARRLAESGVAAVVGHLTEDAASAAAPAYRNANVPFIAPMATSRALARAGERTYTANVTDDLEAERIVAYLQAVLGAKRFVLLHADDAESRGTARSVRQQAQAVGLEVERTHRWSAEAGASDDYLLDAFPELDTIPTSRRESRRERRSRFNLFGGRRKGNLETRLDVDAVVVIGDATSGGRILDQMNRVKLDVPVLGTGRWNTPEFAQQVGKRRGEVYLLSGHTWDIETQAAREWREQVAGANATPDLATLYTYEALQLLAAAAESGATDAEGVAKFLNETFDPDSAVQGLSSLLYFDSDGVMQRQPWFLTVSEGDLRPAFTQLRHVTDPRTEYRALRRAKALPEGVPNTVSNEGGRRVAVVGDRVYHLTAVVLTGMDFYRINDVNVSGQNFEVELFLWFLWQGDVDVENIAFLNQIYTEEGTWEVLRQDLEGDVKYICYKIKGTFLTPYDLHDFPFDTQRLPMSLAHKTLDGNDLALVVDHDRLSHEAILDIYPEEWDYGNRDDFSAMYEPTTTFGDPSFRGPASRSAFSVYQAEIVIKRILFPYLVTMFLPLAIMVVISLFVIFIPRAQFDARMTLTMTALLSILVFHLAQGDALPNVGYLMRADEYFMVTYVLMFLLIVKTVLVNAANDRMSDGVLRWIEGLFNLAFVPITVVTYVALSFR